MGTNAHLKSHLVHAEPFAERTGPTHQRATVLVRRTIERFNDAGRATAFENGAVGGAGHPLRVGFLGVGVVGGALLLRARSACHKRRAVARQPGS